MAGSLPGVLAPLGPLLDHYGYLAVVGVVAVESFGLPAPGQTILIVAGIYAGTGRLNVALVAGLGFLSAVGGDSIGYWIGQAGGRRVVLRVGRYILLTEHRLDKAESFFTRHGGKIVVVARFVDGLRQVNGIVAGLANMRWWRFLTFNAIGAAIWADLWVGLGYLAGEHIDTVYDNVRRCQIYVLITLGLLVIAAAARWLWHRYKHSNRT